jgi:hydroxymethylpyrimidine/phosphomethylpyrimidine kinase
MLVMSKKSTFKIASSLEQMNNMIQFLASSTPSFAMKIGMLPYNHIFHALSSSLSDHCPLLLANDSGPKRPKSFRFDFLAKDAGGIGCG